MSAIPQDHTPFISPPDAHDSGELLRLLREIEEGNFQKLREEPSYTLSDVQYEKVTKKALESHFSTDDWSDLEKKFGLSFTSSQPHRLSPLELATHLLSRSPPDEHRDSIVHLLEHPSIQNCPTLDETKTHLLDMAIRYSHEKTALALLRLGVRPTEQEHVVYVDSPLHIAIRAKDNDLTRELIPNVTDLNAVGPEGRPPPHAALVRKYTGIFWDLVHAGADPKVFDTAGWSPLHLAIAYEQRNTAHSLVLRGVNLEEQNRKGRPVLHAALIAAPILGLTSIADIAIAEGAKVNAQDSAGWTPLHVVISSGNLKRVQALIKAGADVNVQDPEGRVSPPLHAALEWNCPTIARDLLLREETDFNAQDAQGRTPLYIAAATEQVPLIEALLEREADPGISDHRGWTPLHIAAASGKIKSMPALVSNRNAQDQDGKSPLHVAVEHGQAEAVHTLCKFRASITSQDAEGRTPLHTAIACGQTEIAKYLTSKLGTETDIQDCDGNTPLHAALIHNQPSLAHALIEKEANVHLANNKGETPLHLALGNKDPGIARTLLKEEGINVHSPDEEGTTPLHIAIANGHTHIALKIMQEGADVNIPMSSGQSLLEFALTQDLNEIALELIKHGANANTPMSSGESPLEFALKSALYAIAGELLRKGADIDITIDGQSPIEFVTPSLDQDTRDYLQRKNCSPEEHLFLCCLAMAQAQQNPPPVPALAYQA